MEATVMQQVVYNEEMAYAGAPTGFNMGVAWVGPSLMIYGTDEQKKEFLPQHHQPRAHLVHALLGARLQARTSRRSRRARSRTATSG